MQMRVALNLSVMLAIACTSIREGHPQRMRSLILPLVSVPIDVSMRRWKLPRQLE